MAPRTIEQRIAAAPILVIDFDRAETRLLSEAEAADVLRESPFGTFSLIDLLKGLRAFKTIAPDQRREFVIEDVVEITGAKLRTVHRWVQDGLITPSLAGRRGHGQSLKFAWHDAWWAGCVGSLRRAGVPSRLCAEARIVVTQQNEPVGA